MHKNKEVTKIKMMDLMIALRSQAHALQLGNLSCTMTKNQSLSANLVRYLYDSIHWKKFKLIFIELRPHFMYNSRPTLLETIQKTPIC